MATLKHLVGRYALSIYFVLTFIISWGVVFIIVGPKGIPVTTGKIEMLGAAMLLGPAVSCILLTGFISGKEGFRDILSRLLKWRVKARWYMIVILTAPLTSLVVLLALSPYNFSPAIFISESKVSLLLTGIMAGIIVGFFEELGWTGFAVPRMRKRYSILFTGIIVGVLWGAWHFILFLEGDSFFGAMPFVFLLARLLSWLPAYHTDSLFITMLMHVSLVASTIIIDPVLKGSDLLTFILLRAVVLWIIAFRIIMIKRHAAVE